MIRWVVAGCVFAILYLLIQLKVIDELTVPQAVGAGIFTLVVLYIFSTYRLCWLMYDKIDSLQDTIFELKQEIENMRQQDL